MRLIDADALNFDGMSITQIVDAVQDAPTIDAAPVVHGRWESVCGCIVRCNSCGSEAARKSNYCPNCGARMDAKEDKQ